MIYEHLDTPTILPATPEMLPAIPENFTSFLRRRNAVRLTKNVIPAQAGNS
jgi:hypothetical protein